MPSHHANRNRVRLIGGKWRSRLLNFPDAAGLRPTPDRVRETLFNWLQPTLVGASCLDAFAGSGALGLEALSRGAESVVALETDRAALAALRDNATRLDAESFALLPVDALQWLARPAIQRFDIVFLDPPFASDLLESACQLLASHGWLLPNALLYLEAGQRLDTLPLPAHWEWLRAKQAGDVHYGLVQAHSL